eukprot:tig00000940_g5544.t1
MAALFVAGAAAQPAPRTATAGPAHVHLAHEHPHAIRSARRALVAGLPLRSVVGRRFCCEPRRGWAAGGVGRAFASAEPSAGGEGAPEKKPAGPSGVALQAALTAGLLACSACLDGRLAALGAGAALPGPLAAHPLTAALGASLAGTAALGYAAVPFLRRLKAGQYIREDGPQAPHAPQEGRHADDGRSLHAPAPLLVAAAASGGQPHVVAACLATLAFGAVGFADDFLILLARPAPPRPAPPGGLRIAFGALYAAWLATSGAWLAEAAGGAAALGLPLGLRVPLGPLYPAFAVFTLAAMSNGVNLTDGVDGLASGTVAVACVGLAAVLAAAGAGPLSGAAGAGAALGAWRSSRGRLALGAALAAPALAAPAFGPACLLAASAVFLAETLSVVAQVAFFKWTRRRYGEGRRLLRMAPLHHHLELGGWPETKVVAAWYLAGAGAALLALALLPSLPVAPAAAAAALAAL